jgi:hypothetical protein
LPGITVENCADHSSKESYCRLKKDYETGEEMLGPKKEGVEQLINEMNEYFNV